MPLLPFFLFGALAEWEAIVLSFRPSVRGFCGLILKRLTCLFHGTLATLSERPSSGFAVLDKKMPVIVRLQILLACPAS